MLIPMVLDVVVTQAIYLYHSVRRWFHYFTFFIAIVWMWVGGCCCYCHVFCIFVSTTEKRQTMLFSATQTRKVEDLARISLKNVRRENHCVSSWFLTVCRVSLHFLTLSLSLTLSFFMVSMSHVCMCVSLLPCVNDFISSNRSHCTLV